jgi:hypothetical protein
VDWILFAENRDWSGAVVSIVMSLQVKEGKFRDKQMKFQLFRSMLREAGWRRLKDDSKMVLK